MGWCRLRLSTVVTTFPCHGQVWRQIEKYLDNLYTHTLADGGGRIIFLRILTLSTLDMVWTNAILKPQLKYCAVIPIYKFCNLPQVNIHSAIVSLKKPWVIQPLDKLPCQRGTTVPVSFNLGKLPRYSYLAKPEGEWVTVSNEFAEKAGRKWFASP